MQAFNPSAPKRSDAGKAGDPVSRTQLELLAAAPYAVVDVTAANPSVIYQLGVRHALRPGSTMILYSADAGNPFEPGAMPCLAYQLKDTGTLANAPKIRAELLAWLKKAGEQRGDSPVFRLLDFKPPELPGLAEDLPARTQHVEAVLERVESASLQGLPALRTLEKSLGQIADLDSGIVFDLLLAYRRACAWQEMLDLVANMSPALQSTLAVREQLALAQIRFGRADDTEDTLKLLLRNGGKSSVALGLQGHLFKFRWEESRKSNDKTVTLKWLNKAIEAYSDSFRIDSRDPHPGMNAAILIEVRGDSNSRGLLPVVRFGLDQVKCAVPKLWLPAVRYLSQFLAADFERTQAESTTHILRLIRDGRTNRGESVAWIAEIENRLQGRSLPPPVGKPPTNEARDLAALVVRYTSHLDGVPDPNRHLICRALLSGNVSEAARLIRQDLKVTVEMSKKIAQDILDWREQNSAL